jgi:hypothetical protein
MTRRFASQTAYRHALAACSIVLGGTLATSCSRRSTPQGAAAAPPAAGGGGVRASCDNRRGTNACVDYTQEAMVLGEEAMRGLCTGTNGVFATSPCPTDRMIGTCATSGGQLHRYYAGEPLSFTVDSASSDCRTVHSGTWTVAPGAPVAAAAGVPAAASAATPAGGPAPAAGGRLTSCNVPEEHLCKETPHDEAPDDIARARCEGMPGHTFATTPCPQARRIGACTTSAEVTYYYRGVEGASSLPQTCASLQAGTWTAVR